MNWCDLLGHKYGGGRARQVIARLPVPGGVVNYPMTCIEMECARCGHTRDTDCKPTGNAVLTPTPSQAEGETGT